jgi:type I restriction enzyme S subunit
MTTTATRSNSSVTVDSSVETYSRTKSVVFFKTDGTYGGLSNMCGRFPLSVNGIEIRNSESLYQSCRFPDHPEVQNLILDQTSPLLSKNVSKPHRKDKSRTDWDMVQIEVMWWCLKVKLLQNWDEFGGLLWMSGRRPIVEESRKDTFWGTKSTDEGTLVGSNVLGKLLMELRHRYLTDKESLWIVDPPGIPNFRLMGDEIRTLTTA